MHEEEDFAAITNLEFVTAKQMVAICLFIEVIVQSIALIVEPTAWWTWQLLGFIAATNLGAVILAIFAQRSADKISGVYRRVFTPEFYETVTALSEFRMAVIQEAERDGQTVNQSDIAPEVYAVVKDYFNSKQIHEATPTPDVEVPYISPEEVSFINDEELFRDA